jgi:hypothetical protein
VYSTPVSVNEAWIDARRAVPTRTEIWVWGADRCWPSSGSWKEFDALLVESMGDATLRDVHQSLLLRIARVDREVE